MKKAVVSVTIEEKNLDAESLTNRMSEEEAAETLKGNMEFILDQFGIMEDSHVDIQVTISEVE